MPLPNLIHPINVVIEPADRTGTHYDRDAREPVRTVKRSAAVTIEAQVNYRDIANPRWEGGGLSEEVRGYVIFRQKDLTDLGYTPRPGDRITTIGFTSTSLYVLQRQNSGHYDDQNGATLVVAYFGDRRPSANAPSMVT